MRKIFVVGNQTNYANWMNGIVISSMKDADLVVFTGGEDICPEIYNVPENTHPKTHFNKDRDYEESLAFMEALELGKHIVGICRGAQLACVANNGRLIQDQLNPNSKHMMITYDGKQLEVTSSHHQAQYPFNLPEDEYQVLGWTEGMLPFHHDGDTKEMYPPQECEVVYYPKTKCLGIQGHPRIWGV